LHVKDRKRYKNLQSYINLKLEAGSKFKFSMRAREARCFDISGIAISCGAANILVLVHPEEWLVVSAAALVLD
jgi:L-serine deaminase